MGGGDGRGVRRGPRRRDDGPKVGPVVPDDRVDRLEDGELHDGGRADWKKGLTGATVVCMIAFQSVTASACASPAP